MVAEGRGTIERTTVNGVELEYEIAGDGEPVILVHGAFIADAFRPLLSEPELSDRYRVIHFRRRGYGGSGGRDAPVSVEQHASDCLGLLADLGEARAHVVGHSYGGCVALQVAADAPEAVISLALLEPGLAVGASAKGYLEALAAGAARYEEVGAAEVLGEFLEARWPGFREPLEQALPGAFEQAVADADTWFERELQGQLDWRMPELAAITPPTLSLVGGGSMKLWDRFGETHQTLLERVPDAEGFVLPEATHLLHLESPTLARLTASALADFFGRHPLRTG
jgi:pimeloyl-ACP methyl ester carboxylesterase